MSSGMILLVKKIISFNISIYLKKNTNKMNFYFIHIPKTGGTYIQNEYKKEIIKLNAEHPSCLTKDFIKNNCTYRWDSFLLDNDIFNSCEIKFTIVRNPYDLLVSYFHNNWGNCRQENRVNNFSKFIEKYCGEEKWHRPLMKIFIYHQIFDDKGNCHCDIAIPYDNLDEGMLEMFEKYGKKIEIKKKKWNTSKREKDYRIYYNDHLKKLVERKCKKELEMFNFTFEEGFKGENLIYCKNYKINWEELLK